MNLFVLIILSGALCWECCKVAELIMKKSESIAGIMACILFVFVATVFGLGCVGGWFYGLYRLAVAFTGV